MTGIAFKAVNAPEKPSHAKMFRSPHPQLNSQSQNSPVLLQTAIQNCRKCLSTCVAIVCTLLVVVGMMLIVFKPSAEVVNVVVIDTDGPPVFVTNQRYLSLGLDSSVVAEGFRNFNMTDPKLQKLLSNLAPGYFRVGGTMADRLLFITKKEPRFKTQRVSVTDGGSCAYEEEICDVYVRPNFTMSGDEWLLLNRLVANAGFTMLFDLNTLIRFDNGSWNYLNAEDLIAFSDKHNLDVIWELGNEPDAFKHVFNYSVNATQLGKDFIVLKGILAKYPRYRNALLVGPDTTRPKPTHMESVNYLKEFLEVAGNTVDAITWHQYYLNGRNATGFDFIDPTIFDVLHNQINVVKNVVATVGIKNKHIWLGETASAYGGGAPNYSNKFISTFIWLDKLGLAAKNGIELVIRQSFFKGYYALLYDDYSPTPDYWISVLYKKLVAPQVVRCFNVTSQTVRIYCHCAKRNSLYGDMPAVVVFAMNMKGTQAKIVLQENGDRQGQSVLAYVLRTEYSLLSKITILNDRYLSLTVDGSLPEFKPKIVPVRPYLVMPAYSLAFWVVPAPSMKYCAK